MAVSARRVRMNQDIFRWCRMIWNLKQGFRTQKPMKYHCKRCFLQRYGCVGLKRKQNESYDAANPTKPPNPSISKLSKSKMHQNNILPQSLFSPSKKGSNNISIKVSNTSYKNSGISWDFSSPSLNLLGFSIGRWSLLDAWLTKSWLSVRHMGWCLGFWVGIPAMVLEFWMALHKDTVKKTDTEIMWCFDGTVIWNCLWSRIMLGNTTGMQPPFRRNRESLFLKQCRMCKLLV